MTKRGIESQHGGSLVQALVLDETKLVDTTEMRKVYIRLRKERRVSMRGGTVLVQCTFVDIHAIR